MIGSKFAKSLMIGMCITVISTTMAFAETGSVPGSAGGGESGAFQGQQAGIDDELLEKQAEIDKYVFEEHSQEIADKGFKVTYTSPMNNYVEIGITPFTKANAGYLYEAFGRDMIKVVEGQQAVLTTGVAGVAPDSSVSSTVQSNPVDEDLIEKQAEIDKYVFEEHAQEIADKGFAVTHTGPVDNYVEIGITPFTETNADYLYEVFGRDMVKVIEGQEATTMAFGSDSANGAEVYATGNAVTEAVEDSASGSSMIIAIASSVGALIVLGAGIIMMRKRKLSSR